MSRLARVSLVLAFLIAGLGASPAALAATTSGCLPDGEQSSGAIYRICMPENWNGDLVAYAHGYVDPRAPVAIPEDQLELPDGTSLPGLINSLGYAFATTSYSKNGLAIRQGIEDVRDLVSIFKERFPGTHRVYLTGVSEGGLVTTLAVEQHPEVFSGGLAACGPISDFSRQVNYLGDFRVVFDYFFPGLLLPSPVQIPQEMIDGWPSIFAPAVGQAIAANPHATEQLLRVTGAPIDPADPATAAETTLGILWYNVHATNDGISTLGGQPFNNRRRIYLGSDYDIMLNREIQRFQADPAALAEMSAFYRTTGRLSVPLVTLHTTGDPIVPYWHELFYYSKALANHSASMVLSLPVLRYGHCNFTKGEVLAAFAALVYKVSRQRLPGVYPDLQPAEFHQVFLPSVPTR